MIIAVLAGYYFFKINILDLVGTIAGGMTSTPGLAAADSMTDSPAPSVAYATVYPISDGILDLVYTDDSEFDRLNLYLLKNTEYEKKKT